MNFNQHYHLRGKHAILGASQNAWTNYDVNKMATFITNMEAKERGTKLHNFAQDAILLGIKQARSKKTLNQYINDCIGYDMKPEQVLFYSDVCFGTVDAISFSKNTLRIFDLKTGEGKTNMTQLVVYAALFCLEYKVNPHEITIILRKYQYDDYEEYTPEIEVVQEMMNTIQWASDFVMSTKQT